MNKQQYKDMRNHGRGCLFAGIICSLSLIFVPEMRDAPIMSIAAVVMTWIGIDLLVKSSIIKKRKGW